MAVSMVMAFWMVALLLIVVPGPDWAFTLDATLGGQRMIAAVAGLVVGYTALTVVVSTGIGALLARNPGVLTALTMVGGGYLTWQGIATLRRPPALKDVTESPTSTTSTGRGTLAKGIGVSGLNPKALLLFLALLPQFTSSHATWPLAGQLALLGSIFTITCAAFYLLLGTFATTVLHARPTLARAVSRLSGAGMLLIGLSLSIERIVR